MTDAILISANLTMVDIDDAVHHLESNKELYWSVMFPIRTEQFRFPIYAFIHISGRQVEYRALVDRVIPFSPAVFDGPLAEHVKPPSFRDLWKSSRIERERPWRNELVFTEIVPFSFDTRRLEKYAGGQVTLPPRGGYIRVISPNETESFAPPQPAAESEISQKGRIERFARFEKLGLDQVKHDLLNGGFRIVGGPPAVQNLAWEWVRSKEKEKEKENENVVVQPSAAKPTEILTLKPGIWGVSIDLKETWRRLRRWWQRRN